MMSSFAKRKLNMIIRGHESSTAPIHGGYMVQVFIECAAEKRGMFSSTFVVVSVYPSAASITVPGVGHTPLNIAYEDVRLAILDEHLELSVLESMAKISDQIKEEIDLLQWRYDKSDAEEGQDQDYKDQSDSGDQIVRDTDKIDTENHDRSYHKTDQSDLHYPKLTTEVGTTEVEDIISISVSMTMSRYTGP